MVVVVVMGGGEHTIKIKEGCFFLNNLGPKQREAISSIILQKAV